MPGNKRAKISYTQEAFEAAVEAVRNGGLSIRVASKQFKA
jgi:hypothetical protein